jgi:hypothetical protein
MASVEMEKGVNEYPPVEWSSIGVHFMPRTTIRKFVRDVIGLNISRGQSSKIVSKVSRALERPDEELLGDLPD